MNVIVMFREANVKLPTVQDSCVSQLALFQAHPQLKQFVRPSIERSVQELLPPVVERSIKIALTTSEQIVKKVRALDVKCKHIFRFVINQAILFIIFPMSAYYQNTRTCSRNCSALLIRDDYVPSLNVTEYSEVRVYSSSSIG